MFQKIHYAASAFNHSSFTTPVVKLRFFRNALQYVIFLSFLFLSFDSSINAQVKTNQKDQSASVKSSSAKQKLSYPYTAEYSSNFLPGNPAHGKLVLDIWKAWDDNAFDKYADMYADTIIGTFPNGDVLRGKENYIAASKQLRNTFSTVKSTVEAWIPLMSVDRKENWVAVWGREEDTDKNGKTQTTIIHELWRINRDGKVDFYRQYASQMPRE